ncbi:hypothetical protein HUO09_17195 [Vibrio sp. Y2-5]|uniref:hypothetical protein n=1 Tax=Vibrio sp. Y2-5 TaxID=2743977 RepID=UPI00166183EE|nr:hypothetical protein [Vibrio sp. Y2-5]MBD0788092.1 hypothetical protein [Vibrio sp. Y2-5]
MLGTTQKASLALVMFLLPFMTLANQPLILSHDGSDLKTVQLGKYELCIISGLSFLTNSRTTGVPATIKQNKGLWELSLEQYVTPFTVEVRCN